MKRHAYIYVFDSIADWEYGYLMTELNSGRYFKKNVPSFTVRTVGIDPGTITTLGGLKVVPDITVEQMRLTNEDLLVLPGGNTWGESIHSPMLKKVGDALTSGTLVAAICGATEGLANTGHLDSHKHTSNDLLYLQSVSPTYRGRSLYQVLPAVRDKNLITATGLAPLEFAKEVIEALDVFAPDTLSAWYGLNKTNDSTYFFQLIEATNI
ncbi:MULTISPECIES: type 1 glutamine amidotransferase family protein [Exiguobacterium]|uniref:type 1 glutamine amidotransferase family protein n=1 Tax=Exiguobacterium TaxID=33986 RepID=UPI001BEB7F0D|nr:MULTISPECIES: type 1 glutamine amidotransferase family protein [Exiguobacterium]MCT4792995.1 glutamine amidotransferase [Exiguobacterium artemiae]